MISKYRGRAPVQLSPPMVWHNDALDAMLHGQLSVLLGQDSLDDNRQAGDGLQPVHVLPADGGVQGVGRDPVLLWACCLLLLVHVVNIKTGVSVHLMYKCTLDYFSCLYSYW